MRSRSETGMMELILGFIEKDDNIRAAVLNGSRANPAAPKDPFQDFDVACLVRDVSRYTEDDAFLRPFGEILIRQTPDILDFHSRQAQKPPADRTLLREHNFLHFTWLLQFVDGNRIDFSFHSLSRASTVKDDSLTVVLVDKDGILAGIPAASDRDYIVQPPTADLFYGCCNEFWWVGPYIAKGLWRGELAYPRAMMERVVRPQLERMLAWVFGIRTGFRRSAGKFNKYAEAHLPPVERAMLERSCADADPGHVWDALFVMAEMFRSSARFVADTFGFEYPEKEDRNVDSFLHHIRTLPADADRIF